MSQTKFSRCFTTRLSSFFREELNSYKVEEPVVEATVENTEAATEEN